MFAASLIASKVYFYKKTHQGISRFLLKTFAPVLNSRGSAAIDYAVILVFIVLVVVVVIVSLQDRSEEIFKATGTVIGDFGSIKEK